ncbi:hypothetical protein ABPG72_002085 [Tetrahymena utriculariae]
MASIRRSSAEPAHTESMTIIEEVVKDKGVIRRYSKGKFLGKGGFAKCYEFINLDDEKKVQAAKIIPKSSLTKNRARQKLISEIKIHKSLNHTNIVKFQHFFEDQENVYILLEMCANQTMNELIKRRKRLTELEVQCYLLQILYSIKYLHDNRVIHRDLKLGNLFLSDKMQIKLGDFGLATKLDYEGERKRTICGTPNYIAPEILEAKETGHSFEVDVWSFGVIAFTLLIGKPPFETNDVKSTYKKIRTNDYSFPEQIQISSAAKNMIKKILITDPSKRPTVDELFYDDFFKTGGSIPKLLPVSTLACPPSASYTRQFLPLTQASSSSNQKSINYQADKNSSPKKFENTTPINGNGFTRFATQTSYNPQNIKSQQQMGLKERKDYINTYRTGGAQTSSSSGLCNSQYGQKNFDTHNVNNQKIDNFLQTNKNTNGINGSVPQEQCFQKSSSLNPQSEGTTNNLNLGILNFAKSHSTNTQLVENNNLNNQKVEDYIQKMDEYNQKIQPQVQNTNQHKSEDYTKNGSLANQKYTSQANHPPSQAALNSIQSQANVKNINNSTSIGNFAYNQSTAANSNTNLISANINNLSGGATVNNQNYQSQHKNYPSQQSTNAVFNRNSIEKYSSSNNISSGNTNYTRAKSEKMHTQPTSSLLQAYGFTKVEQAPSSGTAALNFNNSGSYFQAPVSSNEVPLQGPDIWVQKWVDYSSKYGLGYLLNNGQAGVFFNDSTKIILNPKTGQFDYIERNSANKQDFGAEYSLKEYPESIQKKLTLLQHFRSFLEGEDKKSDSTEMKTQIQTSSAPKSSKIYVKKWLRTKNAILFRLSNKVVQVIFQDASEIILSSELRAVTYVNRKKERETFPLSTAMESQNKEMSKRLTYTKDILTHMLGGNVQSKNEKQNNENISNKEATSTATNPLGTINLNQDGKEKNHSKNQSINPNSCSNANLYLTASTTTQFANNSSSSQIQPSQKPSTRENLHYSKNVPLSSATNSIYMQNQQPNLIYNNYTQNENINVMFLNKQQSLQQQKSSINGYELNGFASSNSANKKESLAINSNIINNTENKSVAQPTNIQNLLKSNSTIGRMNSMNPTATNSLSNLNNFNNYVMSSRKTEN